MYRSLDSEKIIATIDRLCARIDEFDDPVALAAVNEVEELTTGLSRKIWQKIIIINSETLARRTAG
jgi:hypothetical protein